MGNWSAAGQDALSGGETGAMIGSLFGPVGTGIGAGIGALGGGLLGYFGGDQPADDQSVYKPLPNPYKVGSDAYNAQLAAGRTGIQQNFNTTGNQAQAALAARGLMGGGNEAALQASLAGGQAQAQSNYQNNLIAQTNQQANNWDMMNQENAMRGHEFGVTADQRQQGLTYGMMSDAGQSIPYLNKFGKGLFPGVDGGSGSAWNLDPGAVAMAQATGQSLKLPNGQMFGGPSTPLTNSVAAPTY